MNFEEFLNKYKEEALQIDLAKEYPLVFDILEREKIKLHNADFISEIDEVIKFSEKAVKETKELLKSAFINKHYKTTYIGEKPIFLSQIKIYFDYKLLYNEAIIIKNKPVQTEIQISNEDKDSIFNSMVFNKGLYYYSDTNKVHIKNKYKDLENNFETKEDFVKAVNSLLHANGLHFYSKLRTLTNETEFIKYIQSQYDLYNEYTPNNSLNWLNFTKKAIMYGFGILRIENEHLKALFMNWYNEILKTVIPEQPQQDYEIDIYLKSYNENHFDEVIIKRHEDGTPNNIYLGNNFNEWLTNIDRNLLANKSYDAEIQDKLSTYNKYLLFLAQDLIGLYKAVSGYKKTNNRGFITSIHIQENKVLQSLKSIKFYVEIVKHYSRNKQFQKANDIKDYCISLFDNCVYNLNDVLTIDIYKSPLKTHFEDVKTDLKNSINFEELTLINQLQTKPINQETNILLKLNLQIGYFYKRLCLGNMLKLKENFLVCSDEPLFDIEKLKQYFIDNSLNDFAKSELKKLIELINDFEIKRNEYFLIPNPNPLIFYQYEYVNSKGGKSWGSVSAKLEYFHYTDNKISHLLEIGFKNRSKNSEYIESLTADKIYFKCAEIREVCKIMMQPQQTDFIKSGEVENDLYNHIFKDNAFEIFEKYHTTKNLAENSRTDLNLLFQLFQNDNLFVETVELKHYIKWLNSKYKYSLTELKKVNIKTKPNIQRTNDYNEYKKATLKQPQNRSNHTAP